MNELQEASTTTPIVVAPEEQPRSKRLMLLVGVPAFALLVITMMYLMGGRYVETENAYVKADKIPISSQVSGVIQETLVRENQNVTKGQLLYRLDQEPFKVALAKAESKLSQVRIDILALKASYREKQAEIDLARTKYNFSLRNKQRQTDLAAKHFTSMSSLDDAKEGAEIAAQQVTTVQYDLKRLAESLAGSVNEPVEKHPSYLMAKAELDQAKLDLAHTEIRAPISGTINAPPKPGQFIGAGNITMTLVTNDHPWVEANFTEKELTNVRPGQQVIATIDLYPGKKWKGVVESLSPATGSEFSIIPAQNATGNWVKIAQRVAVRIKLIPEAGSPQLRSGLSSWVKIDTKDTNTAKTT
ncbi:efflux RND transporter periplasmic adaptor subunit [Legionella shakespearei]|uniref:Multidrug efflux system n=1 Tax=Legionella shakespearei DSM 23087 TaxID=1122169 RepID=A0A0W0YSZ2_9GAMM|nr:efflux RND transporter periplasmic adaptor subunit [Legionella shakespearei]KTD60018.1 multidrug efflux system [Legionella shakespearei DSM 23087]